MHQASKVSLFIGPMIAGLAALGCGTSSPDTRSTIPRGASGPTGTGNTVGGATTTGGQGAGGTGSGAGNTGLAIGNTGLGVGGSVVTGAGGTGMQTCATQTTMTELLPVYLVFGFDRSGSMGKGDEDWHDQSLKWDPVSAATQTFFADPASAGLSASLKFFPGTSDEDLRCDETQYVTPDVPMTPLPSTAFATALNAVPQEDWIGGTPTLAVMNGMLGYIEQESALNPGRYAIVLVTDGYPQDCDDSSIEAVAAVAAAAATSVSTYVIGVANPPIDGAPDTVTNLSQIAEAGGTGQAYLIDTGNPAETSAAFAMAIDQIRGSSIACDVQIPEPPSDRSFDKEAVSVTYTSSGAAPTPLSYDPACLGQAWHYDDPAAPTRIVLCPDACSAVQSDPAVVLAVDFACEPLFEIPE